MEGRMLNWNTWLTDGRKYLKSASGRNGAPSKLMPTIQYNLLGMSLEAYVMAITDVHNALPMNHTFTDLVEALDVVCPLPKELRDKILEYEKAQYLCQFEKIEIKELSTEQLADLRSVVAEVGQIAETECARLGVAQEEVNTTEEKS